MKIFLLCLSFFATNCFTVAANPAFVSTQSTKAHQPSAKAMNDNQKVNEIPCAASPHPFSMLPGDPSLVLTTNVDLGDKKLEIMKGKSKPSGLQVIQSLFASYPPFIFTACSKTIQAATGKPESYIGKEMILYQLSQHLKFVRESR